MDWTTNRNGEADVFSAEADDSTAARGRKSAAEIWAKVASDVMPANPHEPWNELRLEVWPDSGRTILFPAKTPYSERRDKAVAEVLWPSLQTRWTACEDNDDLSDADFEAAIADTVSTILDALGEALSELTPPLGVRVNCYSYGEELLRSLP